jgi:putative effector of murein hydrolase LrgA (UPF0299 family)
MTRQYTNSQGLKAAAALAGIGVLVVTLDLAAVQLNRFVGAGAWGLPGMLHCLVPSAVHVLQAYALDYGGALQCPVQMLVSCWPLLAVVAAAI